MLTIPEEFLLLTVTDDAGGFVELPTEAFKSGFIGAAIMELALLDRIDLHVDVPSVAYKELTTGDTGESSQMIRERVELCRAVQTERFKSDKGVNTNSAMTPRLIKKHCELDAEGGHFLEHSMGEMNFSARAHDRILKVARTLADLGGLEKISADNVLEAVQYRTLDRKLWV